MILGVDISTSITGFAIVTDNVLVYYDSIDLRKHKGFFAKTIAIKEKLMDIYEMYQLNNEDRYPGILNFPSSTFISSNRSICLWAASRQQKLSQP